MKQPQFARINAAAFVVAALATSASDASPVEHPTYPPPAQEKQAPGVEKNLKTFDTLDFDVFSNQKWDRLGESHAKDIVVTWPDGHETKGIEKHIEDLKAMFVYAPDIDGTFIAPTGKRFAITMATIGHWKNGTMDHEWLFWDGQDFMKQLGLAKRRRRHEQDTQRCRDRR